MSKKRSKTAGAVVLPLRVPKDVADRVRKCSDQARLADADILRMAIERGLGSVEKMFAA